MVKDWCSWLLQLSFAESLWTGDWHPDQAALDFISLGLVTVLGHRDLHPFLSYAAGACIHLGTLSTEVLRTEGPERGWQEPRHAYPESSCLHYPFLCACSEARTFTTIRPFC